MKKIICLLFAVMLFLTSCAPTEDSNSFSLSLSSYMEDKEFGYYKVIYYECYRYAIIVDPETKVLYNYSRDTGIISPLYESDGSLKLYR